MNNKIPVTVPTVLADKKLSFACGMIACAHFATAETAGAGGALAAKSLFQSFSPGESRGRTLSNSVSQSVRRLDDNGNFIISSLSCWLRSYENWSHYAYLILINVQYHFWSVLTFLCSLHSLNAVFIRLMLDLLLASSPPPVMSSDTTHDAAPSLQCLLNGVTLKILHVR